MGVNNKCDICGYEELLPFKCKYCGGTFCGEHRLPEKHDCTYQFKQNNYSNNLSALKPIDSDPIPKPKENKKNIPNPTYYGQFRTYYYTDQGKRVKPKSNKIIRQFSRKTKRFINSVINSIASLLAVVITITFLGAIYFGPTLGPYLAKYMPAAIGEIQGHDSVYPLPIDSSYVNGSQCYVTEYRNATDPSYNELVNFLKIDNTEQGLYVPGQHVCINFAMELHDNAERNHIKAHIYSIVFTDGERHTYDGFNTTDRGWVYIDDTGYTAEQKSTGAPSVDHIVTPHEGTSYIPQPLFHLPNNWIASQDSMGTVSSIEQLC